LHRRSCGSTGFGAQQACIQSRRQHPALQPILAIVGGVIQQDVSDGAGLMHRHHMPDRQSAGDDRHFEMLRGPALKRIAL
jgi:hypothetical protein